MKGVRKRNVLKEGEKRNDVKGVRKRNYVKVRNDVKGGEKEE